MPEQTRPGRTTAPGSPKGLGWGRPGLIPCPGPARQSPLLPCHLLVDAVPLPLPLPLALLLLTGGLPLLLSGRTCVVHVPYTSALAASPCFLPCWAHACQGHLLPLLSALVFLATLSIAPHRTPPHMMQGRATVVATAAAARLPLHVCFSPCLAPRPTGAVRCPSSVSDPTLRNPSRLCLRIGARCLEDGKPTSPLRPPPRPRDTHLLWPTVGETLARAIPLPQLWPSCIQNIKQYLSGRQPRDRSLRKDAERALCARHLALATCACSLHLPVTKSNRSSPILF